MLLGGFHSWAPANKSGQLAKEFTGGSDVTYSSGSYIYKERGGGFKSYGNVDGGDGSQKAVIEQFPVAAFTGSVAPTFSSRSWSTNFSQYHSAKAVQSLAGGDVAALLWDGFAAPDEIPGQDQTGNGAKEGQSAPL